MLPDDNEFVMKELDRRILARAKADAKELEDGKGKAPKKGKNKDEAKDGNSGEQGEEKKGTKSAEEKDPAKWQEAHMMLAETRSLFHT